VLREIVVGNLILDVGRERTEELDVVEALALVVTELFELEVDVFVEEI